MAKNKNKAKKLQRDIKRREKKKQLKQMVKLEKSILLGVYDNYMKEMSEHEKLKDFMYLGSFNTEPIYMLHDLGKNVGMTKDGSISVKIEVYVVDEEFLSKMDAYKVSKGKNEEARIYNRETIDSPYGPIQVYFFNASNDILRANTKVNTNVKEYFDNKQLKNLILNN